MNYSLLIEERKSSRAFQDKPVAQDVIDAVRKYYETDCRKLVPEIGTELLICGTEAREALESAAGYHEFLIGAPQYMLLLSDEHDCAGINAGYIMEDLSLKLNELGCGTCWLTFTDGAAIAAALAVESGKKVSAILAFGLPARARKKIHLNMFTMSNVSIRAKQQYHDPKKGIDRLVYMDTYGNRNGVDEFIGLYGDILFEAFHAASNSPSYMNRQPYSFVIREGKVILIGEPDELTGPIDAALNLGAVMLHFQAVASEYISSAAWTLPAGEVAGLPEGACAVAEIAV